MTRKAGAKSGARAGTKRASARKSPSLSQGPNANGAAQAAKEQAAAEARDPNSPMQKVSKTQLEAENKNTAMIWGGKDKVPADVAKPPKEDRKKAVLKVQGQTKITREAGKPTDGLPQQGDVVQQGGGGIAIPGGGTGAPR